MASGNSQYIRKIFSLVLCTLFILPSQSYSAGAFANDSCLSLDAQQYLEANSRLIPVGSNFTVEFDFYLYRDNKDYAEIISQGGSYPFYVGINPDLGIRAGDSWIDTGAKMPLKKWVHIALTHTSGEVGTLYIDGKVFATTKGYKVNNGGTATRVGAQYEAGAGERINGCIDNLMIWKSVRTPSEVVQDSLVKSPITNANLIAFYGFDSVGSTGLIEDNAVPSNSLRPFSTPKLIRIEDLLPSQSFSAGVIDVQEAAEVIDVQGSDVSTAVAIDEETPEDRVKNSASNFTEIPRKTNSSMALRLCPTPQALTCIESVSAIYSDGSVYPFTLVDVATDTFLDQKNQKVENDWMQWSFIDNTGATRLIDTYGSLSGENYKGEQVDFNLQPKLTFGFLLGENGIKNEDVTSGIKFKFVFRSSWVVPVASFMMAANGEFLDEKISKGHRYTYIGSPFLGVNFSGPLGDLIEKEAVKTKSSSEEIRMYFLIDHASSIPNGSYVDTKCANYGYPVTSHNAFGGGVPGLTDKDTLTFEIFSPHLLSTGELNKGFFTTDMSVAYMDCFWPGNNVTKSPKVEISVINSDGTVQLATTSVRITKDKIFQVRAFGFHYSQPTIRVKVVQANKIKKTSAVKTSKKMLSITCVKGKMIKKITGTRPSCPSGYKKK